MRQQTISLLFILFISITINAQDWSTDTYKYGEQYPGYVIDANGKKVEGFIKLQNRYVMQDAVIFYKIKDNSSTKKKYDADEIREYKIGDKLYHSINYSGGASVTTIKANLVINDHGCIKEYVWYDRAPGYNTLTKREGESSEDFGNRMFPSRQVFYKDGDQMAVTKEFFEDNFPKKMAAYVADQKELAKKVKGAGRGYQIINLQDIIKEYNANCN